MFLTTSWARPVFTTLDGGFPVPIRVVMSVGPFGWLALALLGALVSLWGSSTRWRLVSAILISLLSIAVMCAAMCTSIERPTHFSASNPRASLEGAARSSLFFGDQRRRASDPERWPA